MGLLEQLDATFKAMTETSTKLPKRQAVGELTSGRRGGARMSLLGQFRRCFYHGFEYSIYLQSRDQNIVETVYKTSDA